MTSLLVTSDWITPQGGAGISQMVFGNTDPVDSSQASSCVDAVGDFFDALKANFPTSVTISVRSIVETITPSNGAKGVTLAATPHAAVTGTDATTTVAAGVGARVRWITAGRRNNRPIIGTTFLVPLDAGVYETNGTLSTTFMTAVVTAGNALLTQVDTAGVPLQVWSRPSTPEADDGFVTEVDGCTCPDRVAWVRTRKY